MNFNITKKKILIIFPSWTLGGSTIYLSHYAKYFISKGYEVFGIYCRIDLGATYLNEIGVNLKISKFPLGLDITATHNNWNFYKIILNAAKFIYGFFFTFFIMLKVNPNFVIIGEYTLLQCLLAVKLFNKKSVVCSQFDISNNLHLKKIINNIVRLSNLLIGITEIHLTQFNKIKRISIHNIVDDLSNKNDFESFFNFLKIKSNFIITFVGGLNPSKGALNFVKLAKRISENRNDICFLLVGPYNKNFSFEHSQGNNNANYDYNLEVFNFMQENNLVKIFRVVGETKYSLELIEKSTILVSMNEYPHFSRPIVEAWSRYTSTIASDDVYGQYLIKDGINGFLASKNNLNIWVDKINNLLDNDILRRKIEKNAFETYLKDFSKEYFYEKMHIWDTFLTDANQNFNK